jgi:2-methylcitrate dehydratase
LLIEKFKTNLARIYDKKQQDAILDLSLDYDKLAATPVNEYLDLLAKS